MEAAHVALHAHKAVTGVGGGGVARAEFDDVFGGPPKHSTPAKAAGVDEYAEIFGGLAASCSIPVLELPVGFDGRDVWVDPRRKGFDYAEVFGGFNGADFGVSYEELLAEKKRPADSNGRVPKKTCIDQQVAEFSKLPPWKPEKEFVHCMGKDETPTNDGVMKVNMSYLKTHRESIEETKSVMTRATQLGTVPEFTFLIDSFSPLQNINCDHSPEIATKDLAINSDLNGTLSDRQEKTLMPSSDNGSTESSVNEDFKDVKQLSTKSAVGDDVSTNLKSHSRPSSYHSTSGGDLSFPDVTYVTVSDVSLRTQPLQEPPPSRSPPKLANSGHPKIVMNANAMDDMDEGGLYKQANNNLAYCRDVFSKSYSLQSSLKDSSPCFFDVEVDASSAAAASASAMKEAMGQMQAKLKSAKELMERKRENLQSHKKLSQQVGIDYKQWKENEAAEELKSFSRDTSEINLLKDGDKMNGFIVQEMQKHLKATKIVLAHEEKERNAAKAEWPQQGSRSSQAMLGEKSVEWKTENQYYELINNDRKCKTVQQVSDQVCNEKMLKVAKMIISEEAEIPNESRRMRKLWEGNEFFEVDNKENLNADVAVAREEETKEILGAIREALVQENDPIILEVSNYSSQGGNKDKSEEPEEDYLEHQDETKQHNEEVPAAYGNIEKNLEDFDHNCTHVTLHECNLQEKVGTLACNACEVKENELSITPEPHENGKIQTIAETTSPKDGNEIGCQSLNVPFMSDAGMEFKSAKRSAKFQNFRKRCEVAEQLYAYEKSETDLGIDVVLELKGSTVVNIPQWSCNTSENEKTLKETQEAAELKKNMNLRAVKEPMENAEHRENIETTRAAPEHMETEKKLEETNAFCLEDNTKKEENEQELQQDDKEHTVKNELENSEDQMMHEADYGKKVNEKSSEIQKALDWNKNQNDTNKVGVTYQMSEDFDVQSTVDLDKIGKDVKTPQVIAEELVAENLENKGKILTFIRVDPESRCMAAGESSSTNAQKMAFTKSESRKKGNEKEHETELIENKSEEVKEREREREKDRLATERATREAHEKMLAEARERAERIAVERLTSEARQRALAEAREKAEKASAEALEKAMAEKVSREARLRAECAAVERATAEARGHAVEKAMSEKAAADAREQTESFNGSFRDKMRKNNEKGNNLRSSDKGENGAKTWSCSSDVSHNEKSESSGSSSNSQNHFASSNHVSYEKFEGAVGESALRCKARLERHQRTVERAAKALAEKNMRDILAQKEQAEKNRIAESLDADVKRWSSGKEGNLRALLSTLQYILGSESGWQPIPLTDVITAAAVKKAYRKATLCVHPDKLQQRGASIQQKYICEKVFDLLKEAWNKFNSEE